MMSSSSENVSTIGYIRFNPDATFDRLLNDIYCLQTAGVKTIIFDIGSGNDPKRLGLNIVFDLVKTHRICRIVTPRLSHLARSCEMYQQVKEMLQHNEVQLHCLDQDLSKDEMNRNQLQDTLQVLITAFEQNRLRERMLKTKGLQRRLIPCLGRRNNIDLNP